MVIEKKTLSSNERGHESIKIDVFSDMGRIKEKKGGRKEEKWRERRKNDLGASATVSAVPNPGLIFGLEQLQPRSSFGPLL